ncbi:hypothetical protein DXV75_03275 [Alteromonas aestuariivivens]|uniref:Prephenate dehydrogenase n=1 Tax=Alteromonas aestuariivivens TaxID=1938339 RepID=A0A3D8MBW3_9ALTE|nr:hypothetical protein [Alteromonas aestuariivivens]RDV28004.1 hypothetical protein DXV75_03275 [Alteromonas aestuariivivens]
MQAIHTQLQETIQTLYRKALDADQSLDKLQQSQQGRFQAVFSEDSGFRTQSRRFSPYVQEIALDWQSLQKMSDTDAKQSLPALVKKIELMLTTLAQFKAALQ